MDDQARRAEDVILEVRAWEICGTSRILVAERVRDKDGRRRMIWHVPAAQVRGFLWLEHLVEEDKPSPALGIE